jgi:hypothetical protein
LLPFRVFGINRLAIGASPLQPHPLMNSHVVQSYPFAAYRGYWLRDPPAPLTIFPALGFSEGECSSSTS